MVRGFVFILNTVKSQTVETVSVDRLKLCSVDAQRRKGPGFSHFCLFFLFVCLLSFVNTTEEIAGCRRLM